MHERKIGEVISKKYKEVVIDPFPVKKDLMFEDKKPKVPPLKQEAGHVVDETKNVLLDNKDVLRATEAVETSSVRDQEVQEGVWATPDHRCTAYEVKCQ